MIERGLEHLGADLGRTERPSIRPGDRQWDIIVEALRVAASLDANLSQCAHVPHAETPPPGGATASQTKQATEANPCPTIPM